VGSSNKLIFGKPVSEIIKSRISVRTYEKQTLGEDIKKKLNGYLENLKGPFGVEVKYKLIESQSAVEKDAKLGTYGIIRGVSSYVASSVSIKDMSLEQLGYELEEFILYATSLGLGTCWLGGTFKKSEFAKTMDLKEGELLPIVTPVGYPAKSKSVIESFMRFAAGSNNRKSWEELFFEGSFEKKLTKNAAGEFGDALEMVRLAPSASNKQPWRLVVEKDKVHFYISHTKGYGSALGFDMQKIDMGIAMCHFDLSLKEAGIEGRFEKSAPDIKLPDESVEYIVSWVR
jgi:nitroreductase